MSALTSRNWVETGMVFLLVAACVACSGGESTDKIPITTSDDSARELYLQGRALLEGHRLTDARELMEQAVAKDAAFALAHLGVASASSSTKESLEAIGRAVAAADGVSAGERLMIMGVDAGSKGVPATEREYFALLVESFPNDERAHNLLAGHFFGVQEYIAAVEHLDQATTLNADFAPAYNMLGYVNQNLERFDAAEAAFKKYIELIPEEPNPYDSYAEFLMKAGRFDESIENYRKALTLDENFSSAHVGIGNNYSFKGETEAALEAFRDLYTIARNDDEKRDALLGTAAALIFAGEHAKANLALEDWLKIPLANQDLATISSDLNLIGTYLSEIGLFEAAQDRFDKAVVAIQSAAVPPEIKSSTSRNHLYHQARLALLMGDLEACARFTDEYVNLVDVFEIPFEVRRSNEILGMLALVQDDFRVAAVELEGADQQDPRVLYYLAKAYIGLDDLEAAHATAEKAANFNGPTINYAFIRARAQQLLQEF